MNYTKEPWVHYDNTTYFEIRSKDGFSFIGDTCASSCDGNKELGEANARRIVACVNACTGVDTEALEITGNALKLATDEVVSQRDALLEALQNLSAAYELLCHATDENPESNSHYRAAIAAIAAAKGEI